MAEKIYGSREDILAALDIEIEDIHIPEWGDRWYRVRGLTGDERDAYEQSIVTMHGNKVFPRFEGARARLVALSIVDEMGKRYFIDADVAALGRKSASALQRVYDLARKLSGLSEEDVEDLAKNSSGAQSEGSSSDSLLL